MAASVLAFLLLPSLSLAEGFVVSSSERFNLQVGDAELQLRSYDAFDEIDDVNGVQSYSVNVGGEGFENIDPNPRFDYAFKRKQSFDTQAEMEAVRPQGGTYVHRLDFGNDNVTDITIVAPDITYDSAIPINPLFTISGVSGDWAPNPYSPDGGYAFYFDPVGVTSFTVTMNAYALLAGIDGIQGDHFVTALFISYWGEETGEFEINEGLQDSGTPTGEIVMTFTQGAPANGGAGSGDLEFGFSAGDSFEFEGEFVNIFDLTESTELDDVFYAYVYQTVTTMNFFASPVPEPATYALFFGLGALGLTVTKRRRGSR